MGCVFCPSLKLKVLQLAAQHGWLATHTILQGMRNVKAVSIDHYLEGIRRFAVFALQHALIGNLLTLSLH